MGKIAVVLYDYLHENGEPNAICKRIASMKPDAIITFAYYGDYGHWGWGYPNGNKNLVPKVVKLLHDNGVKIYGYVPTGWHSWQEGDPYEEAGVLDLDVVKAMIDMSFACGVDGIFLDNTCRFRNDEELAFLPYYRTIYEKVKSAGKSQICNTGSADNAEECMSICDILSVEGFWDGTFQNCVYPRRSPPLEWFPRYGASRFMGFSVYEPIDLAEAIRRTQECWKLGIEWHYSAPCEPWISPYIADYYEDYMKTLGYPKVIEETNRFLLLLAIFVLLSLIISLPSLMKSRSA